MFFLIIILVCLFVFFLSVYISNTVSSTLTSLEWTVSLRICKSSTCHEYILRDLIEEVWKVEALLNCCLKIANYYAQCIID